LMVTWFFISIGYANNSSEKFDKELLSIKNQWEKIKYNTSDKIKEKKMENLEKTINTFSEDYPNRAEPKIWYSIVSTSLVDYKNSLR